MHRIGVSAWCLALLALTLGTGCAYTVRQANTGFLPAGSKVAVTVFGDDVEGPGPDVLEAYLTAALVGRGFEVHPLAVELLAGRNIVDRTLDPASNGMQAGGKVECKVGTECRPSPTPQDRLESIASIIRSVPADRHVQYLLAVQRYAAYGYAAYLVDLSRQAVVNVFVVGAKKDGFKRVLGTPAPKGGTFVSHRAGTTGSTRLNLIRIAEYVVNLL